MRHLILFAVFLLALACGLAASGVAHPAIDFMTNLQWHFVAAGLFLALAGQLFRARGAALAGLCVALFAFYQSQRFEVAESDLTQLSAGQRVYTLVTFNSWGRSDNSGRIISYLRQARPDFVFLQEIGEKKYAQLTGLSDLYPHMRFCAHSLCGALFLSKYPWAGISSRRSGLARLPKIDVQFGPDVGNLRLVLIHAARPHYSYTTQRAQHERLGRDLAANTAPLIVGGDFNATAFAGPMRAFARLSGLKHAGGYMPTWPQRTRHLGDMALPFRQFGLDQFFVNQKVQLIHVEPGPDLGSDHMPLVVTFTLRAGD